MIFIEIMKICDSVKLKIEGFEYAKKKDGAVHIGRKPV